MEIYITSMNNVMKSANNPISTEKYSDLFHFYLKTNASPMPSSAAMVRRGLWELANMEHWTADADTVAGDRTSELDVSLDSPAIRRLIEEVRAEDAGVPRSYNRTFNRHNR